ncbi:hypothetical protein K3495_g7448 [Podosphaera aphanis]|nr:hypothetical protein K3495_g7448 [Podosphaera aphanis]
MTPETAPSKPYSKQFSSRLSVESSNIDKEERKREYNRLAQREFRRRRKEHLKNLEQAQKEQSSERAEEMERLKYMNEELRRENEALRAQVYASSSSGHLMTASIVENPRYSLSPSISGTSISGTSVSGKNSPPTALVGPDMMPMGGMSIASAVMPNSMHVYGHHELSTQPYSMVHSPGIHHNSHSSFESSGLRRTRPSLGSAFHSMKVEVEPSSERYVSVQPAMTVMASYDSDKVRSKIHELFQPLLSDPNISADSQRHFAILRSLSGQLPAQLKPDKAQLEYSHFYGIDLISSYSLRNRLMTVADDVAIGLVEDLGILRAPSDGSEPITYWGDDPFREESWEISKPVLDRWGWLLGSGWIQRANYWRKQRGASILPEW